MIFDLLEFFSPRIALKHLKNEVKKFNLIQPTTSFLRTVVIVRVISRNKTVEYCELIHFVRFFSMAPLRASQTQEQRKAIRETVGNKKSSSLFILHKKSISVNCQIVTANFFGSCNNREKSSLSKFPARISN